MEKAGANRLMVDIHDEYRPTGYSRTFPNLMTQEGIAGDETRPTNELTLAILFTRMLCGPADNTVCYFSPRVRRNSTHAFQLAKTICIFSPWQFLFWYDRPEGAPRKKGGAGGVKRVIVEVPEMEFFKHLPTTWDESRILCGMPGEFAAIARRKGVTWYLGVMNAARWRTLIVPLSFLEKGRLYNMRLYTHDPTAGTPTNVAVKSLVVTSPMNLFLRLGPKEGAAARMVPVRQSGLNASGKGDKDPGLRSFHRS